MGWFFCASGVRGAAPAAAPAGRPSSGNDFGRVDDRRIRLGRVYVGRHDGGLVALSAQLVEALLGQFQDLGAFVGQVHALPRRCQQHARRRLSLPRTRRRGVQHLSHRQ
jgi:hypothetical protein